MLGSRVRIPHGPLILSEGVRDSNAHKNLRIFGAAFTSFSGIPHGPFIIIEGVRDSNVHKNNKIHRVKNFPRENFYYGKKSF